MPKLSSRLVKVRLGTTNDHNILRDALSYSIHKNDKELCRDVIKNARRLLVGKKTARDQKQLSSIYDTWKTGLHFLAKDDFLSFLVYMELNRPPEKRFWQPRSNVLLPVAKDMQDLEDGVIDFLGISLPPRVGKTTLAAFFMSFVMGRNYDTASVMSGHSGVLTNGFYHEMLNLILDKETYNWNSVFFDVPVAGTSAKYETINLGKVKRFPTLTCRSVGGTLTGAVEVGESGLLYTDDLVEDLEEALNPARLDAKYDAYLNQLKDRKKEGAKELMVGTRWNLFDPLGRIKDQYAENERYRFREIPALSSESGESNFGYKHSLGFSTSYYSDMQSSIDDATWNAKYMCAPYIREGLLFNPEELRYYNGQLPDGAVKKLAFCDVAWGGGDYLAMVYAYVFGNDVYIHDVIYNKGDKDATRPVVIGKIMYHMPERTVFEANNGGHEYSDKVDSELRAKGIRLNISWRFAPSNTSKLSRIVRNSPDVKRFYFRDIKARDSDYKAFMRDLTLFTQSGKNKNDDAPDVLSMLAEDLYSGAGKITVMERPW